MKNKFENTGKLVHFVLRRERFSSTLWIILLSAFSIALAPMLAQIFDAPAREALIVTIDNPAMIAMLGPIYGIDNYTSGAMYFNMMIQWVIITAAIMNILLIVRHTRSDEEQGRTNLLRSLPTGRFSNLCAAMITAFLVNLIIAVLTGVGIAVCQVESMDFSSALLYGCSVSAAGFVFAAIAAVFSQLCNSSRGAIGFSISALGFLYLLRGAGDIKNETLSYLSPLGLAQRTEAFVENNWFPIVILFAEAIVITLFAFILNNHRDIQQGLIPEKHGRENARAYLRSPYGLAFRLLRMPFFSWIIGVFIIGAAYGSILGTIDTFVQSSEFYSMMIGANPDFSTAQMFVSMVTSIMALCSVFPVLTMILKVQSEEKNGYYLNMLSNPVSKYHYLASYTLVAFVVSILAECATALGIYASAVAVLPNPDTLPLGYLMKANLVYLPALWVILGIAVLLIGLLPKMTHVIWIYFAFSFFVMFMRRLPDFIPEWVAKLTPFGWIPNLPIDEINFVTLGVLTGISVLLAAIGFIAYRRRDISA